MLVEIAIGDALGISHEFVKNPEKHELRNDLTYQQNPRYNGLRPSMYTDDTLRSVATARAVINAFENDNITSLFDPCTYVTEIQRIYKEDKRPGWSKNFQAHLEKNLDSSPSEFMQGLNPADSNGSVMGVLPLGYLRCPEDVMKAAAAQAIATHSHATIPYAQSLALTAHFYIYRLYFRGDVISLIDAYLPDLFLGHRYMAGSLWDGSPVDMSARSTTLAVLDLLTSKHYNDYSDYATAAIGLGGDTDSVAALVLGLVSVCYGSGKNNLPNELLTQLDEGNGFRFLNEIDIALTKITQPLLLEIKMIGADISRFYQYVIDNEAWSKFTVDDVIWDKSAYEEALQNWAEYPKSIGQFRIGFFDEAEAVRFRLEYA